MTFASDPYSAQYVAEVSPYLGAIITSSEKKKFRKLVKAYGQDSICIQSRYLGNLAMGAIASSSFGLENAEHEPSSGVKQTEIRRCTDLQGRSGFQVDSLYQRRCRQGILTFRRSSGIAPTNRLGGGHLKGRIYLLVCCAGPYEGSEVRRSSPKEGQKREVEADGPIMA